MSALRIFLFGSIRLARGDRPAVEGLSRASQTLLAYLALHRERAHTRDALTTVLWPEVPPRRARDNLNTALWRLRRRLEPNGTARAGILRTSKSGDVSLHLGPAAWLDVAVFEEDLAATLRLGPSDANLDAETLERALSLYTEALCPALYDEWVSAERERLQLLFLRGMIHLLRCHAARGRFEQAIACAQRILVVDPLREEVHRDLMRLFLATGDRSRALRQFEACRDVLDRELEIAPMAETLKLRDQAARHQTPEDPALVVAEVVAPVGSETGFDPIYDTLETLHRALEGVEGAKRALHQAIARRSGPKKLG